LSQYFYLKHVGSTVKNNVSSTQIWEIHFVKNFYFSVSHFFLSEREKAEWQRPLIISLTVSYVRAWVHETSPDPNIYALSLLDMASKFCTPTAFVIVAFWKILTYNFIVIWSEKHKKFQNFINYPCQTES